MKKNILIIGSGGNIGRYIHDNLDFSTDGNSWFYAFHTDTLPLSDVKNIGIATNDQVGNTFVKVLNVN